MRYLPEFLIVPYQLLDDKEISLVDERLYGVIFWLTKMKNEKCVASNTTLATVVKTSSGMIRNSLMKLERLGYIKRLFKDQNKKIRSEIIPLVVFTKVSLVDDNVSLVDDSNVSLGSEQNKNIYNKNNKDSELSSQEVFSFKDELDKLRQSPRKDHKIIALYFKKKEFVFENKKQFQVALRRELRPAGLLTGYTGEQIGASIAYCQKEYDVWTLETVYKRIADLVNKK